MCGFVSAAHLWGCPVRAEIYDNARQMAEKRNLLLSSPEVERDFVAIG